MRTPGSSSSARERPRTCCSRSGIAPATPTVHASPARGTPGHGASRTPCPWPRRRSRSPCEPSSPPTLTVASAPTAPSCTGCSQRTPVSSLPRTTARISAASPRGAGCRFPWTRTSWLTSHDPRKPAEEQHFGGPSLGEDLHASVRCRTPFEGRIGIPHQAVQVREVGCCHGENLSVLVHSPPKNVGLPRGRCDVEPPGIAFAADEQIEYCGLRRHHGERSIRAGVLVTWRRGGSTRCSRMAGRVGRHQGECRKAPGEAAPQGVLLPRCLWNRGRRGCPPRHAHLGRALFNLAVGYLLVCRAGSFDLRKTQHVLVLGAGTLIMSIMPEVLQGRERAVKAPTYLQRGRRRRYRGN